MLFFDLFCRPRPRRAPGPRSRRVRCVLEMLESRLAPSDSVAPLPAGSVVPAPTATQASVAPPAATGQPLPADLTAALAASVNCTVTWSSDVQDGTGWNGSAPGASAPVAPQGAAVPVNPATPGVPTAATVAGVPGTTFSVAWSGNYQDGQGWAVPTPQPQVPVRTTDPAVQPGVM